LFTSSLHERSNGAVNFKNGNVVIPGREKYVETFLLDEDEKCKELIPRTLGHVKF
jgi:hypothetical protein